MHASIPLVQQSTLLPYSSSVHVFPWAFSTVMTLPFRGALHARCTSCHVSVPCCTARPLKPVAALAGSAEQVNTSKPAFHANPQPAAAKAACSLAAAAVLLMGAPGPAIAAPMEALANDVPLVRASSNRSSFRNCCCGSSDAVRTVPECPGTATGPPCFVPPRSMTALGSWHGTAKSRSQSRCWSWSSKYATQGGREAGKREGTGQLAALPATPESGAMHSTSVHLASPDIVAL